MLKVLNSGSVAAHKLIYMSARRKSLSPIALFALLRTVTARFHATVTLDPNARLTIGGHGALDRSQWFGGHWSPFVQWPQWRPEDVSLFSGAYRAHPGRGFFVSGRMAQVQEDPQRPGFVDLSTLRESCARTPPYAWPSDEIDLIVSSKPDQLYPNSCKGPSGKRPKGFMPGSGAAAAEFFALYYEYCLPKMERSRVLMEVSNECEVKTGTNACNSSWTGMVTLHAEVANAVHRAYASAKARAQSAPPKRPLVCGPTSAWPEYQLRDFKMWRTGGQLDEFLAGTRGAIDCLSIHVYSTFQPPTAATGPDSDTDPFSSNYNSREVGNLDAILDLQDAATAASNGGVPLPVLISEYGAGFKVKPVTYSAAHDFWVLRSVINKLMSFMARPDRILKALPFIVNKATWYATGMMNNATQSYPWALWRYVTSNGVSKWKPTHLHKFYAAWRDLDGERFVSESDNANIQVHAFSTPVVVTPVHSGGATLNWSVVVNNVDHRAPARVALSWSALPSGASLEAATVRRLFWDATASAPALTDTDINHTALPATIDLAPAELAIISVRVVAQNRAILVPQTVTDMRTLPSPRMLVPLPGTQHREPFVFTRALANGAIPYRVRIGIGGASAARAVALASMHVVVNGVACTVDPGRQIGGKAHTNLNDGSFLGAIEVPVPVAAAATGPAKDGNAVVKVWSSAAVGGDIGIVISSVALVVVVETLAPSPAPTPAPSMPPIPAHSPPRAKQAAKCELHYSNVTLPPGRTWSYYLWDCEHKLSGQCYSDASFCSTGLWVTNRGCAASLALGCGCCAPLTLPPTIAPSPLAPISSPSAQVAAPTTTPVPRSTAAPPAATTTVAMDSDLTALSSSPQEAESDEAARIEDSEDRVVFTVFGWTARRGKAQFKLGDTWIHTFDLICMCIGILLFALGCMWRKRRLRQAAFTSTAAAPRPNTAQDVNPIFVRENPMVRHPSRNGDSPALEVDGKEAIGWRIVTIDHSTGGGAEGSPRPVSPALLLDSSASMVSMASSSTSSVTL